MVKKRNTETKKYIKVVFTKLLQEKGMESLTVSDIARGAGINRGTFYLHYIDKYDLMEKLADESIIEVSEILLYDNGESDLDDPLELIPYNSILKALYYIKSDLPFFKALASNGGDPFFVDRLKKVLEQLIQTKVSQSDTLQMEKGGLPNDYANEILLSSISAVVLLWLKKDGKESPEEIATMVCKAKELSPYELLI